ncbi:MAG: DNA-3-methyladenine glycosylase I [Legionella sp.]|uniref:DNA-3-methyladenine glycosylase I n=1 Tax=Legionella sp. TaxID=459 RepID=UPI0039E57635
MKTRCPWVGSDPLYMDYHDHEWGVPLYDEHSLFELLILEGMQAGLSWFTILKKRENFRRAFDQFDAQKMALYDQKKSASLMTDTGIIRNRLKIQSAITNAQALLKMNAAGEDFSDYIWQFVDGKPIKNHWTEMRQVPARTPISDVMSKDLKKRGFKFVGSTICYAFMQSVGLVNDHLVDCYCYGAHQ